MSSFVSKNSKIFVAGHRGMVGSAITSKLKEAGFTNLVFKTRQELDLLETKKVLDFLKTEKINVVIDAAAKVGGIVSNNTYRADFIYQNIQIQNNLLWGAHAAEVKYCVFLGSSCIYPKECPQPIKEEYLLTGPLEETNRSYALAKIAGIELIDALNRQYNRKYFSLMPCNLYGPGDNYDPQNSHVIPGLLRKFDAAVKSNSPTVSIWGSGAPLREFLHSHDLADAVLSILNFAPEKVEELFFSKNSYRAFINVGSGSEISIKNLALLLADLFQYKGQIIFDSTKPDGTMRKVMDSSRLLKAGWKPKTTLREGLSAVIKNELPKVLKC